MTNSEALSKPDTIASNPNIFEKTIENTGNNYTTTCMDLALKKISLNTYITSLGIYNLTDYNIENFPSKEENYTYIDYSKPCPNGWNNNNGECTNLTYNGPCDSGKLKSEYRNCDWKYQSKKCSNPINNNSPLVIGIATQFNSVGTGVQSYGNWYNSYCDNNNPKKMCNAVYRLRFSNGVISNMTINSNGRGFTNPDVSFAIEKIPSSGVNSILQIKKDSSNIWYDVDIPPIFIDNKSYIIYGPWISVEKQSETKKLNDGRTVYLIKDKQFTKMISSNGEEKYYEGEINQFNPSSWNTYNNTGGGKYLIKKGAIIKFSGYTSIYKDIPVDYTYECGENVWKCELYEYRKGTNFQNYSIDNKKKWAIDCNAEWPQAIGKVVIPAYSKCNISNTNNTINKIGTISNSEDPKLFAISYIFKNNILPNQDVYFAYYSDGINYNIFVSNTPDSSIFTNKGVYNETLSSKCKNINTNFKNYPVYVFKLDSSIYKDGNFSTCASTNNSINNINRMTSNKQQQEFSQDIKQINEKFTNYEQNQYDTSTTSIQKNLNEIIKNLTDNYNQKAQIYNSTANAIKNHDFILSNRNKILNKQSEDLLKIQDNITLKTREIELNNQTTNKQLFIKRVMQGSFVLFPLIIIILILMYYQVVGPYISLGIISLLVVGYIIYVVVINNKMKLRNFLKPVMGSIQQYENIARQAYKDIVPPVCKEEKGEEEENDGNNQINKSQLNISILNANGPFYYYDGSAPPEQIYPIPIGSIQFDTGDGIVVFPEELGMSLDNTNNIMLYIFFTSWIGLMLKNGINLNDPQFLKKLNITDLEDTPTTYNLPLWENIELPLTSDFEDNIKVKCSRYDDIRSKSGKNASVFLIDTWNFFLGDKIPNDIYEKWLKKINSVLLRNENIPKIYYDFYEFVVSSKQFKQKYPPPNGSSNFIQTKFTDFLNFLSKNVKFAEKPSFDLNFNF